MKLATTTVAALLIGAVVLVAAASAPASAPAFRVYVVCPKLPSQPTPQQIKRKMGKARPRHRCTAASTKAAMFRSNLRDVSFKVCIRFPSGTRPNRSCASEQARDGVLYYNIINTNVPGLHRVTWFVKGRRIGRRTFRVLAPH